MGNFFGIIRYLEWFGSNGRLPVSLVAEHRPKVSNEVDNPKHQTTLDRELFKRENIKRICSTAEAISAML